MSKSFEDIFVETLLSRIAERNSSVQASVVTKEMLDAAIALGREQERERIIKLLEELDDEEWMGINQNFIALIKGENK